MESWCAFEGQTEGWKLASDYNFVRADRDYGMEKLCLRLYMRKRESSIVVCVSLLTMDVALEPVYAPHSSCAT